MLRFSRVCGTRSHWLAALLLGVSLMPAPLLAQGDTTAAAPGFTLRVQTDLVLTDVVVRDRKTGAPVRGLTRDDFTILEGGKPQRLVSFDAQDVDQALRLPGTSTLSGRAGAPAATALGASATQQAAALRDHRLIVLFFDTTSLQPDDLERVQQAARDYVNKSMQNADLVSVVSLGNTLSLDQDFTADKQLLLRAINSYSGGGNQGFGAGATSTTNQVEDTTAFTADESEYNDINTDRELFAIAAIARALGPINQKKSLLYFSGGLQRDGVENQASLRSTINAAVRNNLSIYSVDARGLQAISPLGDASTGSLRGNAAYTGGALQNNLDANFNSQEVLATLSSDTGGKAFFDNNDFAPAFEQVQNDTASYYVLGFRSTNTARDGAYRKLEIRVNRPDVKISYRPGYYAPADFRHSNGEQRERDLEAALNSDLPESDMPVYLEPFFFRDATGRYNMPVSLLVPGSQIPFNKGGDRDKATLDVIGNVKDAKGHVLQQVRDTVKLAISQTEQVTRKNIEYSTGFTLPAGTYHLKFVVRENEGGKLGSFETDVRVPDLSKAPLRMSSVVLASQRVAQTGKEHRIDNPLVYEGQQYIPNLPHVFTRDQSVYFFYEVYDPGKYAKVLATDAAASSPAAKEAGSMHVLTSIELLRGNQKVFESPLVEARTVNIAGRNAVAFAFTVPLASLSDGTYTCQVNVIDDAGGTFAFPRTALLVKGGK
ncbi:VWA domain-containing protein [Acidipila sp. EB88]|uniref:VWA domain-containing protein n=1 Tax=Acidipila sp. EB88 TaxID=2305226 RepID=UPI000F5F0FB2|nr:VWA domain-containing protein [Acidipila sp. EB88]RRA50083.1 VWA domain-containing protein [Acidipila sp. EB88]